MMPVIRLSDATFGDLKSVATWIGAATPSETIEKLVREKMAALDLERDDEPDHAVSDQTGEHLLFDKAPGLSFTKVLSAKVDGQSVSKPNWAGVLLAMIGALKKRGLSAERLVSALDVPSKATPFEDEGYRYHSDLGISVQGQSAQDAWKEASRIAEKHGIPLEVTFRWRDHKKALYPGKTGLLRLPNETGNV